MGSLTGSIKESVPSKDKEHLIGNLTPLKARKSKEAEKEEALKAALLKARSRVPRRESGPKRKAPDDLLPYLAPISLSRSALRPLNEYAPKTFNKTRQILGLIQHLFVRYPVPFFLFQMALSPKGQQEVLGSDWKDPQRNKLQTSLYRRWFLDAAQGRSLAKAAAGVMTKKEAHCFAQIRGCPTIEDAIRIAKLMAQGATEAEAVRILDSLGLRSLAALAGQEERLITLLREVRQEMNHRREGECLDYIRAVAPQGLRLAGRTARGLYKAAQTWHRYACYGSSSAYYSWQGVFPQWTATLKNSLVQAVELTNNRALWDEGCKMKHCVYTYGHACMTGRTSIVSLRWRFRGSGEEPDALELNRLTLEVQLKTKSIIQVRGACNRLPTEEEVKVLRMWAGDNGLAIVPTAWR